MKSQQIISNAILILISFLIKVCALDCGRRLVKHDALIANGVESEEGDWPWHAAIFHIQRQVPSYKCGGSLINSNSVLSAAHCVFEGNGQIVAERLLVHLGKHNVHIHGAHTQEHQVHRVIPHPNFDRSLISNDIAIIRLSNEATFTNYVQPVCLWNPNEPTISKLSERFGTVVGWGVTEEGELATTLRQAVMPVAQWFVCLETNREFFGKYLSGNNFCAGSQNGTSVCSGDSGGSFTFKEDNAYYIRGIVSLALAKQDNKNTCNTKDFVIFTDVAKYLPWIESEVPDLKRPLLDIEKFLNRVRTSSGKEYVIVNLYKTWYNAYEYCRLHKMQLATIESEEENQSFIQLAYKFNGTGDPFFWTSGNDLAVEGTYIWMSSGKPVSYTSWLPGEPNNRDKNNKIEDCIQFQRQPMIYGWNDANCYGKFSFVCETV